MNPGLYIFHGPYDSFPCLVAEQDGVMKCFYSKLGQAVDFPVTHMQEFGRFVELDVDVSNLTATLGRRM